MRNIKLLPAFCSMLLLLACNSKMENKQASDEIKELARQIPETKNERSDFSPPADTTITLNRIDQKKNSPRSTTAAVNEDWDKKIVKNASLTLEVKDFKAFNTMLREKIRSFGGYVASEEQQQSEYKTENVISIKVPVAQFDEAMNQLTANTGTLHEKRVTSQDVTSEFFDTRARLAAKQQIRQRYVDLLSEAKNMEEILHVQSSINSIQEDIEAAAGRIQYLGHAASFSTIHLTYYQIINATAKEEETAKKGLGAKLGQAFKTGASWISELIVGLVSVWPLLLLVLLIIFMIKRATKTEKAGS